MKHISYKLYDPNLNISENAKNMGCSISALKKYLQSKEIDRKFDGYYVRWRNIKEFYKKKPLASLQQASVELGYSVNTIITVR